MSPIIVAVWSQNDPKEPHMRPLYGCLAAALTLSLAACTPTPATTPSPVPTTYQCTPEAGGEPYTCTEAQHQDMLKKDALYAEAEQVYRDFSAEDMKAYVAGTEASDSALAYTTADATAAVREAHEGGILFKNGVPEIKWIRRSPGTTRQGSIATLEACIDNSGPTIYVDGKSIGPGPISLERAYFSRTDSGLKISYFEYEDRQSCDV